MGILHSMANRLALALLIFAIQALSAANAEPGISATAILVGQSAVLSGPLSDTVKEAQKGSQLYFENINARGGILGRKIKLISLDDELKPEKAVANYKKLIEEDKVFVTFAGVGTGTIAAALPLLEQSGVPLIAPFILADSVRAKAGKQAYFLRAGYFDESEKIVEHLTSLGISSVAVASLNNPGGKEVVSNVEAQLARRNLRVAASGLFETNGSNVAAVAKQIAAAAPQAVILFAGGSVGGEFVKLLFETGVHSQIFGLSNVSGELVARALGEQARGIAISQVSQYPWDTTIPVVKEYQQAAQAAKLPISYLGMEGYLAAKFLCEALRRTGKDLTRDRLRATLETGKFDLGGVVFAFTATDHSGSRFVELVMLTRQGRFVR